MSLADGEVARVRLNTDIVSLIGEHTNLKRSGSRFTGLCPFHSEKTPSFSVNEADGLYYCFGCSASGDAITFVREIFGLDFIAAVEYLANRANISLNYVDENTGTKQLSVKKLDLMKVIEAAVDYYHKVLVNDSIAEEARKYLKDRGYGTDIIKQFKLGYAPNLKDSLVKKLKLNRETAEVTGLGYVSDYGYLQDSFRDRIMFPIFDISSKPVAFGGRILPTEKDNMPNLAKYKNSKDSRFYSKKKTLYGLNWAKKEIVQNDYVIICEGYTDVIGFHMSGFTNAVATCGTAFSEEHIKILSSFTKNFVLAFDSDNAGLNAANKVYEWESKYHLIIKVAQFPYGLDPAELARENSELLVTAIHKAKPYLKFRIDRLYLNKDFSSAEVANRVSKEALQLIASHPEEFVRDRYLIELSDLSRIDINLLRNELKKTVSQMSRNSKNRNSAYHTETDLTRTVDEKSNKIEFELNQETRFQYELLKIIVQEPEKMVEYLNTAMITDPTLKSILGVLLSNSSIDEAIMELNEAEANLLRRMAVEELRVPAEDAVARLLVMRLKHLLVVTESKIKNGQEEIDENVLAGLLTKSQAYAQTINSLNRDHLDKSILLKAISVTYGD